mmetsp:Transcript_1701/g.3711  ORF Transcript_1701/g.3711 Transcript_1701/m.3711 type:complete len:104 (-) Transcript_1701:1784-2095(-)
MLQKPSQHPGSPLILNKLAAAVNIAVINSGDKEEEVERTDADVDPEEADEVVEASPPPGPGAVVLSGSLHIRQPGLLLEPSVVQVMEPVGTTPCGALSHLLLP